MLAKCHLQSEYSYIHLPGKMTHQLLRGPILPRKMSINPLILLMLVITSVAFLHVSVRPLHLAPSWASRHDAGKHLPTEASPSSIKHPLIPPKIWQILLPYSSSNDADDPPCTSSIDPSQLADTPSWLAKNPDHAYKLVTLPWASSFVNKHFPHLAPIFHALPNPGLKSDLLRYLILSIEGGVYTDIDTVALKPIDE